MAISKTTLSYDTLIKLLRIISSQHGTSDTSVLIATLAQFVLAGLTGARLPPLRREGVVTKLKITKFIDRLSDRYGIIGSVNRTKLLQEFPFTENYKDMNDVDLISLVKAQLLGVTISPTMLFSLDKWRHNETFRTNYLTASGIRNTAKIVNGFEKRLDIASGLGLLETDPIIEPLVIARLQYNMVFRSILTAYFSNIQLKLNPLMDLDRLTPKHLTLDNIAELLIHLESIQSDGTVDLIPRLKLLNRLRDQLTSDLENEHIRSAAMRYTLGSLFAYKLTGLRDRVDTLIEWIKEGYHR